MRSLQKVKSAFPVQHQVAKATINFSAPPETELLDAIARLIEPHRMTRPNRIKGVVADSRRRFFIKVQRIEALPKKLRIALGRPKRSGRFDWPVEELVNSYIAAERGTRTARVVGYGVVKPVLGIVQEFVLLTEYLDDHVNGLQWLQQHPARAPELVKACMQLILDMRSRHLTHLDLWVANVMVPAIEQEPLQVIDLENVFTRSSDFQSETLGFQLGFLYRKELNRFIDERAYDDLVADLLATHEDFDHAAFQRVYTLSKQNKLSHKKRRAIFLEGKLSLI